MEEIQEKKKDGFFRRLGRFLRNLLITALIIVPIGYSAKLQLKLQKEYRVTDSLRTALEYSRILLDSLKIMQDKEAMLMDSLDDMVDKKLDELATLAMMTMDTTLDWHVARQAIDDRLGHGGWVDTLCASYPESVAAHVKLHYIESRATRIERLNLRLSNKFNDN